MQKLRRGKIANPFSAYYNKKWKNRHRDRRNYHAPYRSKCLAGKIG